MEVNVLILALLCWERKKKVLFLFILVLVSCWNRVKQSFFQVPLQQLRFLFIGCSCLLCLSGFFSGTSPSPPKSQQSSFWLYQQRFVFLWKNNTQKLNFVNLQSIFSTESSTVFQDLENQKSSILFVLFIKRSINKFLQRKAALSLFHTHRERTGRRNHHLLVRDQHFILEAVSATPFLMCDRWS